MKINQTKKIIKGNNSKFRRNFYKPKFVKRRNNSNEEYKVNDIHDKIKEFKNINYDSLIKPKKNIGCQTHYELPYKNINFVSNIKLQRSKSAIGLLGAKFSPARNKNFLNSKYNLSNILLQSGNINTIILDKRNLKSVMLSEMAKRNKISLKNKFIFRNKNDINDLYKMMNDYDLSVDYNKNSTILQRYNLNNTPIKEKLYGSYQKNAINNNIFNTNKKNKIFIPFKKIYENKFSLKNHISII